MCECSDDKLYWSSCWSCYTKERSEGNCWEKEWVLTVKSHALESFLDLRRLRFNFILQTKLFVFLKVGFKLLFAHFWFTVLRTLGRLGFLIDRGFKEIKNLRRFRQDLLWRTKNEVIFGLLEDRCDFKVFRWCSKGHFNLILPEIWVLLQLRSECARYVVIAFELVFFILLQRVRKLASCAKFVHT